MVEETVKDYAKYLTEVNFKKEVYTIRFLGPIIAN